MNSPKFVTICEVEANDRFRTKKKLIDSTYTDGVRKQTHKDRKVQYRVLTSNAKGVERVLACVFERIKLTRMLKAGKVADLVLERPCGQKKIG